MLRHILCVLVALFLLVGLSEAAPKKGSVTTGQGQIKQVSHDKTWKTAEVVQGRFETSGTDLEQAALGFIEARKDWFRIERPDAELRLKHRDTDKLGKSHLKFEQRYNGLAVWGREKIVHFDSDGAIYLVAGQTIPTPNIATDPKVPGDRAESTARESAKAATNGAEVKAENELVIFPTDAGETRLAWKVTLVGVTRADIRYLVFVDAISGQVIQQFSDIHFDGPTVGGGTDVAGNNRTLQTYQIGSTYYMINATKSMYQPPVNGLDGVVVTYNNLLNGGPIQTDPNGDNTWNDNNGLKAAVSGHYYAALTYDYFLSTFGRNSLDDNGMSIVVNVHDPTYVNNAFWNGSSVNFADGNGTTYLPFSGSLDVVAHELAHGVTDFTADLIYTFQSGALNESYSDVFGSMVDRDDWLIAEEIRLTFPGFMRSMENPNAGNQPKYLSEYQNLTIDQDNGGVHVNSGIPNWTAYLVAEAITKEKMEQIWYRTLTTYLTPSSDFNFWVAMTLQSTIDLYGEPSAELTAVADAMTTVGFGLIIASPTEVIPLGVEIGTFSDTVITVTNRYNETIQWTGVTSAQGHVDITTSGPSVLTTGASFDITVTADATSLTDCNIGYLYDTVVVTTTSADPTIEIPVTVAIGYVSTGNQSRQLTTSCMTTAVNYLPSMTDMVRGGSDVLYKGSLLISYASGGDTTMYVDLNDTPSWAVIDSLAAGTIGTDETRTVRLASPDGVIQGKVTYQYEPSDAAGCGYVVADYWLVNRCGASLTFFSGLLADFDVLSSGTNRAGYDAVNNVVYVRDASNTVAAGMALLNATPRNLRAINNPSLIWPGWTAENAYKQMDFTTNNSGTTGDDWSALLTFGQNTLDAGDSVHYRAAFLYSTAGSGGLASIISEITPQVISCCQGTTGNVNVAGIVDLADLSMLVAYLTVAAPNKPVLSCPEEANINGAGIIDLGDLSLLVGYLTVPAPNKPVLPNCPQ